jgi:hypothetical protein
MTFNPLESYVVHKARKAADKAYEDAHWGTHYVFGVQWSGRDPLVFEIRAPDGVELVDAVALVRAARGAPAWIGDGLNGLEQAAQIPGVVCIAALRGTADPEPQREVLATLTVTFAEPDGPFDIETYMPKDSASTIKSDQDYRQLSDTVWRIHRISGESQGEGKEPLPVLLIEYVWETKHGLLTLAFATTRIDMMGEKAADLFHAIWGTAYIGEEPSVAS